jgi:hypothetical protein
MLLKLGCGIAKAAGLHPLATTDHVKMEEDVKTVTATFDNILRCCEALHTIFEKEDEFGEIAITLV